MVASAGSRAAACWNMQAKGHGMQANGGGMHAHFARTGNAPATVSVTNLMRAQSAEEIPNDERGHYNLKQAT